MTFLSPWWLLMLLPVHALLDSYVLARRQVPRARVRRIP